MSIGKLQFYTTLLKHIKDNDLKKEEVKDWLKVQLDELGDMYNPMDLLEWVQVGTRKFSELVIESVLEMKKDYRNPNSQKTFYTAPEIYKGLNRTKGAFTQWKNNGWFPNAIKDGKSWKVPSNDLEEFLENFPKYKEFFKTNH